MFQIHINVSPNIRCYDYNSNQLLSVNLIGPVKRKRNIS